MFRIKIIILLSFSFATKVFAIGDGHIFPDSLIITKKEQFKKSLKTPVFLLGGGLIALSDNDFFSNEELTEARNKELPHFKTSIDDYLQYTPILAVYGLDLAGIKAKHNFANRTAIFIKSELLMMAIVFPLKTWTHELRPDGSAYNSFPSGHTAQAFVAATFMDREYGHLSPWYSIGAYTVATSVGILRVLNNRHYLSDVLVGAGIGIISTNLIYLTHKYKWKRKMPGKLTLMPTYFKKNIGLTMNFKL